VFVWHLLCNRIYRGISVQIAIGLRDALRGAQDIYWLSISRVLDYFDWYFENQQTSSATS